jgi:catechol 2,3-dioxygenase-like lactoylglutathione lyase family enzyme
LERGIVPTDLHLDHVLIAVRDLGEAAAHYDSLGFTLTPLGVHPARGTHNRLVLFAAAYLELISVRDPAEAAAHRPDFLSFLRSREGLYRFALGSGDIEAAVASLRARGLPVSEPLAGARQGTEDVAGYTWRFATIPSRSLPGAEVFLIEHDHTMAERYQALPHANRHPNGALGIDRLAIAVRDAERTAARWQELLGLKAGPVVSGGSILGNNRSVSLHLCNCYLDFICPLGVGRLSRFLDRYGEGLYWLSLEVGELEATRGYLTAQGIEIGSITEEAGRRATVVESKSAHGVVIQFIQA